jgi:hypothetical protein
MMQASPLFMPAYITDFIHRSNKTPSVTAVTPPSRMEALGDFYFTIIFNSAFLIINLFFSDW